MICFLIYYHCELTVSMVNNLLKHFTEQLNTGQLQVHVASALFPGPFSSLVRGRPGNEANVA